MIYSVRCNLLPGPVMEFWSYKGKKGSYTEGKSSGKGGDIAL